MKRDVKNKDIQRPKVEMLERLNGAHSVEEFEKIAAEVFNKHLSYFPPRYTYIDLLDSMAGEASIRKNK